MEPEEIAVVLSRASELHSKLSDTIHRLPDLPNGPSNTASAELQSLASVRDALELLEEQLDALQVLQQQQRAERDAGLAAIEESRRVLLRRLNEHTGRELEVIQEALAFAGGTVPEKEDLPLPPYPKIYDEESPQVRPVSVPSRGSRPEGRSEMGEEQQDRSEVLDFEVEDAQEDDEGSEGDFEYEEEREPDSLIGVAVNAANAVKTSGAFAFVVPSVKSSVSFLGSIVEKVTGQVTGPSSKVLLIVVSTLAVLSLTDLGERRRKSVSRVSKTPAHRSQHHHHHHIAAAQLNGQADCVKSPHAECSPHAKDEPSHTSKVEPPAPDEQSPKKSMKMNLGDEFPKCVVRERLELPFYQELQTPDVLYGRG